MSQQLQSGLQQPGRGVNHRDPSVVTDDRFASLQDRELVLTKFHLKTPDLIPPTIVKVARAKDRTMDIKHKQEARNAKLSQVGRLRDGRIDTCLAKFIYNLGFVQAGYLRRGLANTRINDDGLITSFRLAEQPHWYETVVYPTQKPGMRYRPDPVTKFVVVAAYTWCTPEEVVQHDQQTIEALRFLASSTWNHLHGHYNPDKSVVLDFIGNCGIQKPKHVVRIRQGAIVAEPVDGSISEEEETSDLGTVEQPVITGERLQIPTGIITSA